ncbi:putative feruloyl esterase B precursor [Mytilinidion resinicola]|uniref:Carboxylic ester hydrolase n=1 Tax=Mytilinidion resinicola TaxID=574789 RepID=A0A6A6YAY1_9PEZI|nr:putative feruloyl esterase B precursor [Mytilinidion resinicola]KAF2805972.1 putative feruloyl esterase B precursor [Mytilinidion resinicola]
MAFRRTCGTPMRVKDPPRMHASPLAAAKHTNFTSLLALRSATMFLLIFSVLLYLPFLHINAASFKYACESFEPVVENATIEIVEYIPRNKIVDLKYRDTTCGGPGTNSPVAQDFCRVALNISTSDRSSIEFEAWLPNNWNGRFVATGNGGIGGCLDYAIIEYAAEYGFAAVGSNNGHNGTGGTSFFHNTDVVEDFAGRSLHTATLVGKEVTKQYYGKPHRYAYFFGCSQGGRQGIGAAEKYPLDFDGIVAGSPATDFNNLISWRASFFTITGAANSFDFIKASMWTGLIHDEVLRQCDFIDHVRDEIIEYPDLCHFKPETLKCRDLQFGDECLTAEQVEIVRKIFSPFTYDNGTIIYPAMQPGSELRAIDRLYAGKPFSDSQDWFRYVVYSDPAWNPATFTTRDAAVVEALNPFNVRTFPSGLQAFNASGGKLLVYHGQADQQITSLETERWYDHLASGMNASPSQLDAFTRFFRISGMHHCNSGAGAWMIGQSKQEGIPFDGQYNVLAAIVDWVEKGKAPDVIEGTKFVNDTAASGVEFRRRHCRYPLRNRYTGPALYYLNGIVPAGGDHIQITSADDWECS